MKTILVPTDFSGVASNTLEYALAAATVTQARILLTHVVDNTAAFSDFSPNMDSIGTQLFSDAKQKLTHLANRLRGSSPVEIEPICTSGNLVAELNTLVTRHSVGFVVMGTHGQSGLLDNIFGTNALTYMNHAKCPVLLVPQEAKFNGIRQIAFAYDLDSDITSTLEQLFQWAAPFNAQVSIFNCLSERQLNIVPDLPLLQSIVEKYPVENYSLVQRKADDVVKSIFDFVQEHEMQVLAISTHERIFLEELLHKSVSKRLLFNTPVPLIALQETLHYPKKQQLQELMSQETFSL